MATSVASSIAPRTSDARQIRSRETELAPVRLSGQNLVAVVAGEQIGQVGGGRHQRRLTRRRSGGELPVRSEESAWERRQVNTVDHGLLLYGRRRPRERIFLSQSTARVGRYSNRRRAKLRGDRGFR